MVNNIIVVVVVTYLNELNLKITPKRHLSTARFIKTEMKKLHYQHDTIKTKHNLKSSE